MSIFKAIQRLSVPGTVPLESSGALAVQVGAQTPYHVRPVPELYSGPVGYTRRRVTPLLLLEALGEVTAAPLTPEGELLLWAGSWAISRYLWAFDDVDAKTGELRMHTITDNLRHHRRQLFSEDFGIAVAAHALMQRLWGCGEPPLLLDADWELENLVARKVVTRTGPKRPDYVGWYDSAAGRTFVVLECKGCSSFAQRKYPAAP